MKSPIHTMNAGAFTFASRGSILGDMIGRYEKAARERMELFDMNTTRIPHQVLRTMIDGD